MKKQYKKGIALIVIGIFFGIIAASLGMASESTSSGSYAASGVFALMGIVSLVLGFVVIGLKRHDEYGRVPRDVGSEIRNDANNPVNDYFNTGFKEMQERNRQFKDENHL